MTANPSEQANNIAENQLPVKIAFGITELDPGGAERAFVQLITRLDRSHWEPHVFCLSEGGDLVEPLEKAGVPVTCMGVKSSRDLLVIRKIVKYLKNLQPQILQTYLYHANIAGRIAGKLGGVKTIVSGIRVAERRSKFPLWLDRQTDHMVDIHVCVSEDVAQFTRETGKIGQEKLVVIPNGVEFERFSTAEPADLGQFGIPPGAITAIVVGRLDPQKGPLDLLEALKKVIPDHPDFHVLYVGSGPLEEELREQIQMLNFSNQVHLAGWRGDIPELLKASSMLILPSKWEGMPNVVLEAMAAGLPVISTRVEGISEILTDSETGLLAPVGETRILAEKIEQLLANPSLASQLGHNAQSLASKEFTWKKTVEKYENLYLSLLKK